MSQDCFPPLIDDCLVITGPTAAGKSTVAVRLAQQVGGEILSLDSIAVYRGMDIGTAKPTWQDRQGIPHHLIDLVEPSEAFSVACYLQAAHQAVGEIRGRGRRAVFVGGTPMFLKAILRGFDPGPPADWNFRQAVEADLQRHGIAALRARLEQVDPLAASRIAPSDARRMIRALEVAYQTGTPISHRQLQFEQARSSDTCHVFSLQWPRPELHRRINHRVQRMFANGLVDEVRGLLAEYGQLSHTAAQAVGYREIIAALAAGGDPDQTQAEVAAHTRQMARRQETWLRSFREIRFLAVDESSDLTSVADELAEKLD